MSDHKRYLGDLIGGSLMIRESQIIADLLLKNPTPDEWNEAIAVDNILQKPSAASAKRNASTVRKRLNGLNDEYLQKLAYSGAEEATQLMFAATLINSPLLADFMRIVVTDAKRMYRESLNVDDWTHFWEERTRLYPALADMSEASTYKIAQVAFKVIADAGYIDSTKNKKLMNIYVSPDVRELLSDMQRDDILRVMEP
ncbi:hypothetical protein BS333_20900 (plasmid) [Vibrio azureus]|uniref:Inner membrane protein n=1 Tax=Vibrio azureus NBRC 104587 TaxID=1219077 RepID=U3C194_9VIBR|nr:DUF1819 family protein [Vibrio azureus]AUI88835.1 hypothetical protein BS333_20900 [Vibrio azureus]GAD75274.1 hypothetical protein VAZ01S_023_00410 [Vibrio azureus NBRC 104587]